MSDDELDAPPRISVEVLDDHTASTGSGEGFLRVRRLTVKNRHADGHESEPYRYDMVERDAMDAVAIVLEADGVHGPLVCLRSALRPPLAFRPEYEIPLEADGACVLWEVPAGLIEPDEKGVEGILACAARETLEEVGLTISPASFSLLGPACALSPGMVGEKVHFVHAHVDRSMRGTPTEDGSPVEERAQVRFVPIDEALAATRDGRIADVKTEIAIRRLAELSA
jgi:ADP-ribose pyrophosphatase